MEADRLTYGKTFHQIATGTIQLDEGMMSCSGNDRVESPFTISPVTASILFNFRCHSSLKLIGP
jgi:hypothetical protein